MLCAAHTPRKLVRREPSSPSSTSPQMAHTTVNTYRAEHAPLVVMIISGHRVPGCNLPLLSSLLSSYLTFLLPHSTSLLDTRTCRIAWHLYLCFHLWPLVLFVASIRTGPCVLYFPTAHSLHACQQGHHPILPQRAPGRLPAVRVAPTASALFALWMLSPRRLALFWPCLPTPSYRLLHPTCSCFCSRSSRSSCSSSTCYYRYCCCTSYLARNSKFFVAPNPTPICRDIQTSP